jgi:hypothetical protein
MSGLQSSSSNTPELEKIQAHVRIALRFIESIRAKGLISGDRQNVHLSRDASTAMNVGKRHGRPIILVIRARPFLLVLLGDRYGWVPPGRRVQIAAAEHGLDMDIERKSITALGIEYGTLPKPIEHLSCILPVSQFRRAKPNK